MSMFIRHLTGILVGIALNTKISGRERGWHLQQVKFSNP